MARNSAFSFSLAALLLLSGCQVPDPIVKVFNDNIGPLVGIRLQSASAPAPKKTPGPNDVPELPSPDHRQVNAEAIKEIFKVVLKRELRNEEEFMKYMNVLDQGGHFEGIYNGLVYSDEYREKEKGTAPVTALKTYADLMAQIQLDQKYDSLKLQPPAKDELTPPQPSQAERTALAAQNEREGMTKSFFFLKRRLGEEALKTIDLKKEYKEKFATWFGRFTVFLNKKGVDFGFPSRNRSDEYFYYRWALDADEDRLKWECLNRIHQIMNSAN